jgi:hypothetical protein
MSQLLKRLHLLSLSFGFLSAVALIFNTVIFILLFPEVTQFQELSRPWESFGLVVGLNFLAISLFHLSTVVTLLMHLTIQKTTTRLKGITVALGIISGIMILVDMVLLSDIGKEYVHGLQTRGEWIVLFISYGLHVIFLILALISIITNLEEDQKPAENVLKDEVLFLSLHSTGWVCGCLGTLCVAAAFFTKIPTRIMIQVIPTFGTLILSPYVFILGLWLYKKRGEKIGSWLDEKQFLDISRASLWTLLISAPIMIGYFSLQAVSSIQEHWNLLWFPAYLFSTLLVFSSLTQRFYRH